MSDITAQMAASMGSIDAQNQLSETAATANANKEPANRRNQFSAASGSSLSIELPIPGSITHDFPGKGAPGIGITFGGLGIAGPVGVGGVGVPIAAKQVLDGHPDLQEKLKTVYNNAGGGVAGMKAVKDWMNSHSHIQSAFQSAVKSTMQNDLQLGKPGGVGHKMAKVAFAKDYNNTAVAMYQQEQEEYQEEAMLKEMLGIPAVPMSTPTSQEIVQQMGIDGESSMIAA